MSYRVWEFLRAEEVYIYPSANSDDGGDVNSEHNLSEITYKMVFRNFVACHEGDIVLDQNNEVISAPLFVSIDDSTNFPEIHVQPGVAVINGYLLRISPINDEYFVYPIDENHITDMTGFVRESNEAYSHLYDENGDKILYPPSYYEELGYSDLPRLYLTLKLVKNSTGNVRGDMYKREEGSVIRVNKGLAISLLNKDELSELNVPYLVIGNIYYQNGQWMAENPPDKYQFISETMIINNYGMTFNEWLITQINSRLKKLDTITRMVLGSNEIYDVDVDLSVRDGNVIVTRYKRLGNTIIEDDINGEKTGDLVYRYVPYNGQNDYDKTYSIDDIQKRTHPASKIGDSPIYPSDNYIAHKLEPNEDDGSGYHKVWLGVVQPGYVTNSSGGSDGYLTENGTSKLTARSDHRHDKRYLMISNAWASSSEVQTIGTTVKFLEEIFNTNGNNKVWYVTKNGDSSFKSLIVTGSFTLGGNLTVNGNTNLKGNVTFSGGDKTFTVHGDSVFKNDAHFEKTVRVDHDVQVSEDLSVSGNSLLNNVEANYLAVKKNNTNYLLVDPNNNLIKLNATTINVIGNTTFTGPISVTGTAKVNTLSVTNNATVGGNLNVTGDIHGARVYGAVWNDYAELYLKDDINEEIEPGTVICKIKDKNTYGPCACNRTSRKLVVGVSTDNYGHLIGGDKDLSHNENLKKYVPVALAGRVFVKMEPGVVVEEGDLLVPSLGYNGRASVGEVFGSVIGKALESSDGSKNKILMQVFLS